MFKEFDSLYIETSLNSFKDIFSEYFSDKSKWEIRTLDDFYISVNKKDQEVTDSLFIYVKDSKDISHKVIDFEMVLEKIIYFLLILLKQIKEKYSEQSFLK